MSFRFFECTHTFTVHLVYSWVLKVMRAFIICCPLGCRGSACVELMTTLHGSSPFLQRRIEDCVPLEGTIALLNGCPKSQHGLSFSFIVWVLGITHNRNLNSLLSFSLSSFLPFLPFLTSFLSPFDCSM